MFCPNCGTQNADTGQACTKCGFQLKGAAAPKFKGTMMMNQPPPSAPVPPTPRPAPPAPSAAIPGQGPGANAPVSQFKGTVVGVAGFGGGIPPTPPRAPSNPPPQPQFGAPPSTRGSQPPPYGAPPQPYSPPANVNAPNPMASTMADPGPFGSPPSPYGAPPSPYGAPPQTDAPQGGSFGGFGQPQQPQYGAPPQDPQGFGAPPQGFGPPAQPPQYGAPPQGFGAPMQAYDPTQNVPGQAIQVAGATPLQQYSGPGGFAPPAGGAGGAMIPGGNGPKGQVRQGNKVLLYSIFSCGIYQVIWFIAVCNEMSAFLKRDEPSWLKVLGLSVVTCNVYGLYWFAVKLGALIAEIQQRAGVAQPQNLGWMYVIPYYNLILITDELNKAWQTPG